MMKCRHCSTTLRHTFLDLGFAPPSNAYRSHVDLSTPEAHYPLRVKVCDQCWLVQTEDYTHAGDLFTSDYAYFSSTSKTWLAHASDYCAAMTARLDLSVRSFVVEVASNDGYLLRNFVSAGVPCLGIEPTESTAEAARQLGIPVLQEFFGQPLAAQLAARGQRADLIVGNNVFAHVPDINDFTAGLKMLLKPQGIVTLEFPHLLELVSQGQFDTVYHEHFSYLSLHVVRRIFESRDLKVVDVDLLPTHGGSLRVYGAHADSSHPVRQSVEQLLAREREAGLTQLAGYKGFQGRADKAKDDLLAFLIEQKRLGRKVAAYGAAAKGNTLLNYAGVRPDLLPMVCDAAAAKQGKYMPGSHIPILSPEALFDFKPDYALVLPWNLFDEVKAQLKPLQDSGCKFVRAIPALEVS